MKKYFSFDDEYISGWQYFQSPMCSVQPTFKKLSVYKLDEHISFIYYDIDNDEISKEESLEDDNWLSDALSQYQSFKDC
jgi:hypothetical protein